MRPTDIKAAARGPWRNLPIVLSVVAAGALTYASWPVGGSVRQPSNQISEARKPQATTGALTPPGVRLGDLNQPAPEVEKARNPFKFFVPPPQQKPVALQTAAPLKRDDQGSAALPQPSSLPIPIKFIGVVAQGANNVAIFSDGKGSPVWASEGQTVLGQYWLLKISVESVIMSYLDGSGRQAIPMRGW